MYGCIKNLFSYSTSNCRLMSSETNNTKITPPTIDNFIIYNPVIGRKQEEKEKLLYFWPPTTPLDDQLNFCGFFEAIVNFSTFFFSCIIRVFGLFHVYLSSFSKNFGGACESVHLEKQRFLFLEPEQDIFMILVCFTVLQIDLLIFPFRWLKIRLCL